MRLLVFLLINLILSGNIFADQNLGLPSLKIPDENPQSPEKIALGKALFHDQRFSANGSISCASCHDSRKNFSDGLPLAKGIHAQIGTRNTPSVVNAAFYETQFLDGRAKDLETQALGPLLNSKEHGLKDYQTLVAIIQNDSSYVQQFKNSFAIQGSEITIAYVTKAIASYERTLISGNSAFDRFLFGRDHSTLSSSAIRGLGIFKRKGNCVTCHEISWNNALFSDNRFYNLGVGFQRIATVLENFIDAVNQGKNPEDFPLSTSQRSELGRFNVTKIISDIGKFKNPTLRNIALTAPYMHDGSIKTLEEVIEYYDKGGYKNAFLDTKIFPLHLTPQEKADLLAFLQSLTSQSVQP